jgi:hypothetical protein
MNDIFLLHINKIQIGIFCIKLNHILNLSSIMYNFIVFMNKFCKYYLNYLEKNLNCNWCKQYHCLCYLNRYCNFKLKRLWGRIQYRSDRLHLLNYIRNSMKYTPKLYMFCNWGHKHHKDYLQCLSNIHQNITDKKFSLRIFCILK